MAPFSFVGSICPLTCDPGARTQGKARYLGAMSVAAETLAEHSDTTYYSPFDIAQLYLCAGKNDQAFEWLEKSFDARDPNMPYVGALPLFDSLRDEPRFQDLLRRMNLPQ